MDVILEAKASMMQLLSRSLYDALFEVDENGYIKSLEDDGNYQYYNPVSVEDGVIGTIQNDEGVDSVANNGINQVDQWFFTTRSAAEEYYYSKVNPEGLDVVRSLSMGLLGRRRGLAILLSLGAAP